MSHKHSVTDEKGREIGGLYYRDDDGDSKRSQTVYDSDNRKVDKTYDPETRELRDGSPAKLSDLFGF